MAFRRANPILQNTVTLLVLCLCVQGRAQNCLSNPCQNGGNCQETPDGFTCHCPTMPQAFTGPYCGALYDACTEFKCPNTHICHANFGYITYECHCQSGINCTTNECDRNPCALQNSQCTNEGDGFVCKCQNGYSGLKCQEKVPPCAQNPCDHNGHCLENMDNYSCVCQTGYTGQHCEVVVNKCASNPCQNEAICLDKGDKYLCFCVPGFQGHHCDIDINECASKPCQNSGSCLNLMDHYECICATGYTGVNCETEIDECLSYPCQNGATCLDHLGYFLCECPAGYEGEFCQEDIDECQSQPCQNGGVCVDAINRFHCNCSDTGFVGDLCETDIPECASNPCQNNATCLEGIKGYICLCWAGYFGDHCELDIDDCADHPCLYSGLCLERSNQTLYRTQPEFNTEFSYSNAAGYVCRCQPGLTGENCSVHIDECESDPCQNGGICIDLRNEFFCHCALGYTGVLCAVNIDDCESGPCHNGASCEDGVADYTCRCPSPMLGGTTWGGKNCSVSLEGCLKHSCQNDTICIPTYEGETHGYTCRCQPGFYGENCSIPTTFSFTSGYILYELVVNNTGNTSAEEDVVHISVRFRTTLPNMVILYRGNEENFLLLELYNGLLHVVFSSNISSYLVIDEHRVDDGQWYKAEVYLNLTLKVTLHQVGHVKGSFSRSQPFGAWYDSLFPESLTSVHVGGIAQDSLLNNTLSKQNFTGCLEDLTIDFEILLPQNIESGRSFDMTLGCHKKDWCFPNPCHHEAPCIDQWTSYRCECIRPYIGPTCLQEYASGTFFREHIPSFANFTIPQHIGDTFNVSAFIRTLKPDGLLLQISNGTEDYLVIYLKSGQIHVTTLSGKTLSFKENISNGQKHPINISFKEGQAIVNGIKFEKELGQLPPVSISADDTVLVGGMPLGGNIDQWGGYFKGCLQDLRINGYRFEFFPPDYKGIASFFGSISNITKECVSDDTCHSDPCKNDGTCTVTWNDFTCNCTANFTGPTCEEPVWCRQRPCPPESTCHDIPGGYTCLVNATFNEQSSVIFTPNISSDVQLTSISMDFRTRDKDAVLLQAFKDLDYISITIKGGHLLIAIQSGNSVESVQFDRKIMVSDALWHRVVLFMKDPMEVPSQWTINLDNGLNMTLQGNAGSLNFLAEDTPITLAGNYTGCLGQVSIGGLHLPFADQLFPQSFIRKQSGPLEVGCRGRDVCGEAPCLHDGRCQDLFNSFSCVCVAGWKGLLCEVNLCVHGLYTDLVTDYRCTCFPGYTGSNCETNVDDCQHHRCVNGGSCVDGVDSYTCICPALFTGSHCERRFPPEQCAKNVTCLNGGKCIGRGFGANCSCRPGFKGKRCEININDCDPNPCKNGGSCQDLVNNYKCICNASFSGAHCDKPRFSQGAKASTLLGSAIGTGMLFILLLVIAIIMVTMRKKRATQGTYSPSRQEKEGARVEMWNVLKLPPTERLI